jgi:hypothetical protein
MVRGTVPLHFGVSVACCVGGPRYGETNGSARLAEPRVRPPRAASHPVARAVRRLKGRLTGPTRACSSARRRAAFRLATRSQSACAHATTTMMMWLENEPQIAAIAQRLREFLQRQPGFSIGAFAPMTGVSEQALRDTLAPERRLVDPAVLIDAIVGVVRHYGVDAHWLLTGEYDPVGHRVSDGQGVSRSEVRQLLSQRVPSWSPPRPGVGVPA